MIIGLVGSPSSGKSTFFKAATLAEVEIANFPFVTITPNVGIAYVKVDCVDSLFKTQCNPREGFCLDHKRFVPFKLIDVAGLVPGASEGKGMGNQFLSDLNQADALIHVIDAAGATNEKGEPCNPGTHDPTLNVQFLEDELDVWYLQVLKKGWEKFARRVQQEKQDAAKEIAKQLSGMNVTEAMAKEVIKSLPSDVTSWSEKQLQELASLLRQKSKPMIIAANKCDIPEAKENVEKLKKQFPNHIIIPCSSDAELALREAAKKELIHYIPGENSFTINKDVSAEQKKALEFIQKQVLDIWQSTGVQNILNTAVFDILKYIAIFPGGMHKLEDKDGNVLPDCFLLPSGSTALSFAYKIHKDIGDNFIKAMDVKSKKPVGKEHVLQHLDVLEIMTKK